MEASAPSSNAGETTCGWAKEYGMQLVGLFVMNVTLMFRRFVLYVIHLVIPIVCLGVLWFSGYLSEEFVKPVCDSAMIADNPFAEPQELHPPPINLPILQNGITLGLEYDGNYVPSMVIYKNETPVEFLSKVQQWNVTWESRDTDSYARKDGITFVLQDDYLMHLANYRVDDVLSLDEELGDVYDWDLDDIFYDAHYHEEFAEGDVDLSPILAGVTFVADPAAELSYVLVRENGQLPRKEAPTITTMLLSLRNNYTSSSSFCRLAGLVSLMFDCEGSLTPSLMSIINGGYIMDQVGIFRNSYVQQMPAFSEGMLLSANMTDNYVIQLISFCIVVLLPLFVYEIVRDKESGARTQMALMGLTNSAYWIVKFVLFFGFYCVFVFFFMIFGTYVVRFRVFTQVSFGLHFLILLGNGLCLISFAFLFSVFFNSAFLSLFAGFFFAIIMPSFASTLRTRLFVNLDVNIEIAIKLLLLFFPVQIVEVFGRMWEPILRNEKISTEVLWSDGHLFVAVLSLYIGGLLMGAATWYFSQVTSQPHQLKRSPFFVCQWFGALGCCSETKQGDERVLRPDYVEEEAVKRERRAIARMRPSELKKYGLVLRGLAKKYPGATKYSVRGVNLRVKQGECLGLLGKNGAGKTTTIRVVTSQVTPTHGTAYVRGKNIRRSAGPIRKLVGVCEQFDSLFEELTPEETLLFYARLRGVPFKEQKKHVHEILRAVGLEEAEIPLEDDSSLDRSRETDTKETVDHFRCVLDYVLGRTTVGNLNAGSKRRLSIGIAVVGNPDIIYLDEPTTGLDLTARRKIWQIIHQLKTQGHAIVITTHSMREAEELSDRIAIMSLGRLKALGTAQYLKERFGQGVSIQVKPAEGKMKEAKDFMDALLWESHTFLVHDFDNTMTWKVLDPGSMVVSNVFASLQKAQRVDGLLSDWRYRENTLEDVFVALVERDETGPHANEQRLRKRILTLESAMDRMRKERRKLKDFVLEQESVDDQIVSFLGGDESDDSTDSFTSRTDRDPQDRKKKVENDRNRAGEGGGFLATLQNGTIPFFVQLYFMLKKHATIAVRDWMITLIELAFGAILPLLLAILFWGSAPPDSRLYFDAVDIPPLMACESEWSDCYQFVYATNGHPLAKEIMAHLITNYTEVSNVRGFNSSHTMLEWIYDHPNRTMAGIGFGTTEFLPPYMIPYIEWTVYTNRTALDGVRGDLVDIAPRLQLLLDNAVLYLNGDPFDSIRVSVQDSPLVPLKEKDSKYSTYLQMGVPFTLMSSFFVLLFAAFAMTWDKQSGLLEFLQMMGMKRLPIVLSYAVWFVFFATVSSVISYLMFYLCENPIIRNQNVELGLFLLLTFSFTQLTFSAVVMPFLNSMRSVQLFSLLYLMFSFLLMIVIGPELILSIYDVDHPDAETVWLMAVKFGLIPLLFPVVVGGKIYLDVASLTIPIFDYESRAFVENLGYKWSDMFEERYDPSLDLTTPPTYVFYIALWGSSIVYVLLGGLISLAMTRCYCGHPEQEMSEGPMLYDSDSSSDVSLDALDQQSAIGIEMKNITKKYDLSSPKVVQNMNLIVPEGRLCTIVGSCGAGKTTCMKMITGATRITSGDIWVQGASVKSKLGQIRSRLGYVPQQCVLLPSLTAAEMLLLCAASRGVSVSQMAKEVDSLLRRVNLLDVRSDLVGTFSGGMKRRLSVAVSLLGSPEVILLDEPSTGVDPYSKYQIWTMLQEMKGKKTILMTSHELEEAEVLSDLIAVLGADRKVSFLGSPMELKKRCCRTSFDVTIEIIEGREDGLHELMLHFDRAELLSNLSTIYVYRIHSEFFEQLLFLLKSLEDLIVRDVEEEESTDGVQETETGKKSTFEHDVDILVSEREYNGPAPLNSSEIAENLSHDDDHESFVFEGESGSYEEVEIEEEEEGEYEEEEIIVEEEEGEEFVEEFVDEVSEEEEVVSSPEEDEESDLILEQPKRTKLKRPSSLQIERPTPRSSQHPKKRRIIRRSVASPSSKTFNFISSWKGGSPSPTESRRRIRRPGPGERHSNPSSIAVVDLGDDEDRLTPRKAIPIRRLRRKTPSSAKKVGANYEKKNRTRTARAVAPLPEKRGVQKKNSQPIPTIVDLAAENQLEEGDAKPRSARTLVLRRKSTVTGSRSRSQSVSSNVSLSRRGRDHPVDLPPIDRLPIGRDIELDDVSLSILSDLDLVLMFKDDEDATAKSPMTPIPTILKTGAFVVRWGITQSFEEVFEG